MAKLSRKQILDAKRQAKEARDAIIEEIRETNPDLADQKEASRAQKKDKMGFTREDRKQILERQSEIDRPGPKISWNFDIGDLVYLPCGSVGLIVENNAIDLEVKQYDNDMKKMLSRNRYAGQVYVVTSSGNNWYYPKQLKNIR